MRNRITRLTVLAMIMLAASPMAAHAARAIGTGL